MRLTSPRFNWNLRLQKTADNSPPAKMGDFGHYIRHIQQALIELHHPLPRSTAKHGTPDGQFGRETRDAVMDFQREQRKSHPRFGVDGIVGEQTMGVFDRLLRTRITLPALPAGDPGDATDGDANLVQSLINVLSHPRLAEIQFSAMGVTISRGSYLMVRKALQDGDITAQRDPKMAPNVRGVYLARPGRHRQTGEILVPANTFLLPFAQAVTVAQKATVVHEATHAFCDISRVGAFEHFTRDQSESIAHIAQAAFHRILTGKAEADPGFSKPAEGMNPLLLKADELAQVVLARKPLTTTMISELHRQVNQVRVLSRLPNTTDYNGL